MKKIIGFLLIFCLLFSTCSVGISSVFATTEITAGTNVIGFFGDDSFYDSADFNYSASELGSMQKHSGTPILLGNTDDLVTNYGSWSLSVDSTSALRGANYPQYMPRATEDALYLPLPISANAIRAVKGMKSGATYTVSFKYKATASTTGDVVQFIMASKPGDCQPQDTANNKVYISNTTTTDWQIASFEVVNNFNDANGYVYIAFDNNAKGVYIDDLSIVEKETQTPPPSQDTEGTNVIGAYKAESFYDSADFNYSASELGAMQKYSGTPILLGNTDDLVTNYGSWSLSVDSTSALRGANYPQFMPRATENALYLPLPISANAVRAVKGMTSGVTYVVSFKYKATASTTGDVVQFIMANKAGDCQPQDTANNKVYTSATTTTDWQIASFEVVNNFNDANGYVYIAFDNNGKAVYIDDLSIVEKAQPTPPPQDTDANNVIGAYKAESFYDSATFNYSASELAQMQKYSSTPILLGTPDDLVTKYGSWSLTVDSVGTLKGAAYPQFMPRATEDALYLPLPISANAIRAVKGMSYGGAYTVSFKYKATSSTAGDVVQFIMANKISDCQPGDTATNKVYTSNATTTDWQIASFDLINSYNDASGYVYIAFDNNGKGVYIDDLSIVKKPSFSVSAETAAGSENFGFVAPPVTTIYESDFVLGETSVTLTATENAGSTFVGWYDASEGGTKLSSDAVFEYKPSAAESSTVYARFTSENLVGAKNATNPDDTAGFEKISTDKNALRMPILSDDSPEGTGNIPPESLENTISAFKEQDKYYGKWFVQNIKETGATYSYTDSFEYLQVVDNPLNDSTVNGSKQALALSNSRHFVRKIDGLEKDHKYLVSFQYYQPFSSTPSKSADLMVGIEMDEKTYFGSSNVADISCFENGSWTTVSFVYNHRLVNQIGYLRFARGASSGLCYIDNIAVLDVTDKETVTITAKINEEHKNFGNVAAEKIAAVKGEKVSVFACPFAGYHFSNWTESGKTNLLSENVQYTFEAKEISLVANFDVADVKIGRSRGGKITGAASGTYNIGKELTVTAVPSAGNTFAGWYDVNTDTLLSNNATYSFTVTGALNIIAKFAGDNVEPIDILDLNGFETDKTGTWNFYYRDKDLYDETWIKTTVKTDRAYTGQKALEINAPLREAILTLPTVAEDTDYILSFYYWLPAVPAPTEDVPNPVPATLVNAYVSAEKYAVAVGAENIASVTLKPVATTGWHKVSLKFNSGENTQLYLGMRLDSSLQNGWFDDITLVEYASNESLVNGDFANDKVAWKGDFTVSDNIANISAGSSIYQYVDVKNDSEYALSYKVKVENGGSLTAGIYDPLGGVTSKDQITSYSYDIATNTVWENHKVTVFSADNHFVKIAFTNTGSGAALIDDISFKLEAGAADGIVEKIDFERERYTVEGTAQQAAFEIVQDAEKGNVLKYKKGSGEIALSQSWTRLKLSSLLPYLYTLTMDVKTTSGNKIVILPDKDQNYYKLEDCTVTAKGDGWQQITYSFPNLKLYASVELLIKALASTGDDVYIDDITLKVTTSFISDTNVDLYCPNLYSIIKNPDFEEDFSNKDWNGIFNANQLVAKDAASNNRFVKIKAGQKIVVPVNVATGNILTFAYFARVSNGGKGTVTLSTDNSAKSILADISGKTTSTTNISNEKWKRFGYAISTGSYETFYVTLECTKGEMGIDLLSLFDGKYSYETNPNDYERPVHFNYEAFINGEDVGVDDGASPSTGDTTSALILVLFMFIISAATLVLFKRKEEM